MNPSIRIRVAACPGDAKDWNFYVINDSDRPLGRVVLEKFEHEWGNSSEISNPNAEILDLAPGAHALLWEENDLEFRMSLYLRVFAGETEDNFGIHFGYLYKRKHELLFVAGLGETGCIRSAGNP